MRLTRSLTGGVLVVVGVVGVLVSLAAADALAELGIKEPDAKQRVIEALNSGYVNFSPAGKALKAAAPAVREALVKGVLAWAKAYTESPEFKTAYSNLRENQKPDAVASRGSSDERVKQQRAETEKAIAEAKKNLANLPANLSPEMRKAMEDGVQQAVKAMTAQLAELDKPETRALMKQMFDADSAGAQREYQTRLKEYETRYPVDPRPFIARRLRQFLDESATVDFGAKLVASGRVMRFADPRYEDKSSDWKLCYRAGKPAVDAARTFATTWLAELERK
jgi:hypothetical protein